MLELNKIHFGDCIELMQNLNRGDINLVHSDPPYEFASKTSLNRGGGIFKEGQPGKYEQLKNVKDNIGLTYNPTIYLDECRRVMTKFNGYFWTNRHLLKAYINYAEKYHFNWDIHVWTKGDPAPLFGDCYMPDKEYCFFMRESGAYWNNKNQFKNYYTYYHMDKKLVKKLDHPTIKPLPMIVSHINNSCPEGGVVFDGYVGSGTTAVASIKAGVDYIACEINKKWFNLSTEKTETFKIEYNGRNNQV